MSDLPFSPPLRWSHLLRCARPLAPNSASSHKCNPHIYLTSTTNQTNCKLLLPSKNSSISHTSWSWLWPSSLRLRLYNTATLSLGETLQVTDLAWFRKENRRHRFLRLRLRLLTLRCQLRRARARQHPPAEERQLQPKAPSPDTSAAASPRPRHPPSFHTPVERPCGGLASAANIHRKRPGRFLINAASFSYTL